MQKWIVHVAMMSNRISNLIVFEIFATEHEYLRFCVYPVLMQFTVSKLESARHPCSTSPSVGNLLSATKRTVKITESFSAGFAPDGPHLFPTGNTKYPSSTTPLVVVSRSKPPSTTP